VHGVVMASRVLLTFLLVSLAWVLFRSPSFGSAAAVYRALFVGGGGPGLLTGWQAVLSCGIVAFGVARLLLDRLGIDPTWPQMRPLAQAGTLAGLLLALMMLSWPGLSPAFIYFKF
jgi:hypothetical protein